MQEEEEVYRVNVDDDTHPSHEFINEPVRIPSPRGQQPNDKRGHSSQKYGGSGSRGIRRKKTFETTIQDTIAVHIQEVHNRAYHHLLANGAHHHLLTNGVKHLLLDNGAHHHLLNNGVHHPLNKGARNYPLNNGAHNYPLNNGAHNHLLNNGVHPQLINGAHPQLLNNGVVLQEQLPLMFNMDFHSGVNKKFQITH
ncbi:unnamed protein product [Cochlearia groenlandica]